MSKNEKLRLIVMAIICAILVAVAVSLCVEVVIQPSLDEVSIYCVVDESLGAVPYARQLSNVPMEILQSFIANGWKFSIDFDHNAKLSTPLNTNWGGITDYAAKTIWVRYTCSVVHEFGHYLDMELGFPKHHEELYKLESQSAKDILGYYSTTNSKEYFAEMFDYWIVNKDDAQAMACLQIVAPKTYEYFLELSQNNWGLSTDMVVVKVLLPWTENRER
jgi:hypothetical protein